MSNRFISFFTFGIIAFLFNLADIGDRIKGYTWDLGDAAGCTLVMLIIFGIGYYYGFTDSDK